MKEIYNFILKSIYILLCNNNPCNIYSRYMIATNQNIKINKMIINSNNNRILLIHPFKITKYMQ